MQRIGKLSDKGLDSIFSELLHSAILEGRELALASTGSCLEPLVQEGDVILFKRVDANRLRPLDLIVFKEKNSYIAHRFVKKLNNNGNSYILTRSDASGELDSPISSEAFIALVTKIKKPDRIIYLDTFKGRLRSYINIVVAPLYLRSKKIKLRLMPKQEKEYFGREKELLRLISQPNVAESSISRAKELLADDLNWDYIFDRIKWNFIAPFASRYFIHSELKRQVPLKFQDRLRAIYVWQFYQDTTVYWQLNDILAAFNRNKIKVMITKGAQLGTEIYGNTFFRWMGDVDILAKIDDWPKMQEIFRKLGFRFSQNAYTPWGLKYLDNHMTFFREKIKLELKFNLWPIDFPYFKDELWQRARTITLLGKKVLVPSREDTLLIACINLTRHNYTGLIWLVDIREIINKFREQMDWDAVIKSAQEQDIDCMVYYALYYSTQLLHYKLPNDDILKRLRPTLIKQRLHRLFWNEKMILWKKQGHPFRARIAFEIAILLFGGKLSLKPRRLLKMLFYISKIIMPNRAHLSRRYGIGKDSPQLLFYYLLQPFRFSLMGLGSLLAVVLGRKSRIIK